MVKRSFTKEKELPMKRDFGYAKSTGKEFGAANMNTMGNLGRSIIEKFVSDNKIRETKLLSKEEEIEKFRVSKPTPQFNPWKFSNHIIEEFSKFPADKIHSYKKYPKEKFLITEPFRIPKKEGDYFESKLKII